MSARRPWWRRSPWHPGAVPSDRKRRLSRRGHYLLSFGTVQVGLGLAYLSPPVTEAGRLAATYLPPSVYVVLSLAAGITSAVAAFARPSLERVAFGLLAVVAAVRALVYVGVAIQTGEPVILTGALAFALLLRIHVLVAGWPEAPPAQTVSLTQEQLQLLAEELRRRHRTR